MQHAAMAIALYRIAAGIEALVDYCPGPVSIILKPFVSQINRIGDWHYQQSRTQP